jgi:NAD(P)-dependent dehydrogenase (short-subunit alcohol dehydrogenase family)
MHRYRAPSIAPGTLFVAQSWADFIINMSESNLRQAQVAAGVVFLASPVASRISGANLIIDGALTKAV